MPASDEIKARLLARMRSVLDFEPPHEQAASFIDWFVKSDTTPNESLVWDHFYMGGGQLRDTGFDTQREVMKAVLDELVQIRLETLKAAGFTDEVLELPGLGPPPGHMPDDEDERFPVLHEDEKSWRAATLLNREVCMLDSVEKLTNKPEWWIKCHDEDVCKRWKNEMLAMDWPRILNLPHADFTPGMADTVIEELRQKAKLYEEDGIIPVMDFSMVVIKSDKLMTEDLRDSLRAAVAQLEKVPNYMKDWHPGSDEKVLDLVHPSLWPLDYGYTRILPDKRICLQEALAHCGAGVVTPKHQQCERSTVAQSARFQWLPCDVAVSSDGEATIDSYINNLHPVHHKQLYPVIERFIEKSLPAWDVVYRWPEVFEIKRLECFTTYRECSVPEVCKPNYECLADNRPLEPGEPERSEEEEEYYLGSERERKDEAWFEETHTLRKPDPNPDDLLLKLKPGDARTSGFFDSTSRIQVIVKLANIHLTPESPEYEGGSWHIEGMLNEHICATALYYYDSENITDSHLAFRTRGNGGDGLNQGDFSYPQGQHDDILKMFAMNQDFFTVQDIGQVLTREGRALFFPNVYQHRVSSFRLADPTKPGHRKILALFLVDPRVPVISTANVPPQQKHWWAEQAARASAALSTKLPLELREMVIGEVDDLRDLDEAKKVRLELMEERTQGNGKLSEGIEREEYNFCEH